jgi:hypothetical protein
MKMHANNFCVYGLVNRYNDKRNSENSLFLQALPHSDILNTMINIMHVSKEICTKHSTCMSDFLWQPGRLSERPKWHSYQGMTNFKISCLSSGQVKTIFSCPDFYGIFCVVICPDF